MQPSSSICDLALALQSVILTSQDVLMSKHGFRQRSKQTMGLVQLLHGRFALRTGHVRLSLSCACSCAAPSSIVACRLRHHNKQVNAICILGPSILRSFIDHVISRDISSRVISNTHADCDNQAIPMRDNESHEFCM